jgi:hypothetical protein
VAGGNQQGDFAMTFAEFLIFLAACLPFALMALAGSGK